MPTTYSACTVRSSAGGEHQLVAARAVKEGELLLTEPPVLHVPLGRYRLGTYVWDMVDKLLADPTLLQSYNRHKLLASQQLLDVQDQAIEDVLVKKYNKSRQLIRTLYCSIGTNNVGVLNEDMAVIGYGIFPQLSRSDHSCEPTASITTGDWRAQQVNLVAKKDLKAGEPVTWCYFKESDFLPQDYLTRNVALLNIYRFICRCPRCRAERPPELPAFGPKLVDYFDKIIQAEARRLSATPEGISQMVAQTPMNMHKDLLRRTRGKLPGSPIT